jgi:hypothetical protein
MAGEFGRDRRYYPGNSTREDEGPRREGRYQRPGTERGWSEQPESERGYGSDPVYGREGREGGGRFPERERPFSDEHEANRGRQTNSERERGYGAGMSGDSFSRDSSNRPYLGRGFEDERARLQSGHSSEHRRDYGDSDHNSGWSSGSRSSGPGGYSGSGHTGYAGAGSGYGNSWEGNARSTSGARESGGGYRQLGLGGLQAGGFGSWEVPGGAEASSGPGYSRATPERTGQGHYGRGPKGYTRSDERIREDISERLYADHHVDASEITITVESGEVTLSGSVETRRMKHRAEDIADAVAGVNDVHNHLKVTRGVISQIAERVQHGVEKLTGSSEKTESFRTSADTGASPNNRHHS